MRKGSALIVGALLVHAPTRACECALTIPETLCATLDPGWPIAPDVLVLGIKLDQVDYGMHVKVLQVFDGQVMVGDTLTVWGDNGACCRWLVNTWADGDTVVWAFNATDFAGNIVDPFGPQLEEAGDYCINGCGTYWLDYQNGTVSGDIAPGVLSISVNDLWTAVGQCMSSGVSTIARSDGLSVRNAPDGVWLSLTTTARAQLMVTDALGRSIVQRDWNGAPLQLGDLSPGAYIVQVRTEERRWTRKFVVP